MAIRSGKIISLLEEIAPPHFQAEWDNSGLQVGNRDWLVDKILLALDITHEVVQYATDHGFRFILSHHPLLFHKLNRIDLATSTGQIIALALANNITIYSMHTNLDVIKGGVSDVLADLLGLTQVEVLDREMGGQVPLDTPPDCGLGRIGLLSESLSLGAFAAHVVTVLDCPPPRLCGEDNMIIRKVAVCGGSGGNYVGLAQSRRADVLVTGDIDHHQALDALQMGLALVDPGHYFSEIPVLNWVSAVLGSKLSPEIVITRYPGSTNPFRQNLNSF